MSNIQVQTQVLLDTAEKVKSINSNMTEKLDEITREINNLEADWKGDASSEIRSAINALKPKMEQYRDVVNDYAQYLINTANNWGDSESAIQSKAETFK